MSDYKKIFSESNIIVNRLKSILEEEGITSIIKSDKIPGYEITNHQSELFVAEENFEKALEITTAFKKEINQ